MFEAKWASPQATFGEFRTRVIDQAAEAPDTVFAAPPGYLLSDCLAASLSERSSNTMWLRLDHEDCDPANFLLSLIQCMQSIHSAHGQETFKRMRQRPGVINGWQPLFSQLAEEIGEGLSSSSALVFENIHRLGNRQPILGLFSSFMLWELPEHISRIVISNGSGTEQLISTDRAIVTRTEDLKVELVTAANLATQYGVRFSTEGMKNAVQLAEGRAEALAGIFQACDALGNDFVEDALQRSRDFTNFGIRIARAILSLGEPEALSALALTLHLGYCRPDLVEAALGEKINLSGPWIQHLSGDWLRVRSIWKPVLQATIRRSNLNINQPISRAAGFLEAQGAAGKATELYLDAGEHRKAARTLSNIVNDMMSCGQWITLNRWLEQIPEQKLREWPWLVYARGEISAAKGELDHAQKLFATSEALFEKKRMLKGVCHSLLAESVLAAWRDDYHSAEKLALAASAKAREAGLTRFEGWSSWHLGVLAIGANQPRRAMDYFEQALAAIKEPGFAEMIRNALSLASRQAGIQRQLEDHTQAYLSLEEAQREVLKLLEQVLGVSGKSISNLIAHYGWLNVPMIVKPMKEPFAPLLLDANEIDSRAQTEPRLAKRILRKAISVLSLPRLLGQKQAGEELPPGSPKRLPDTITHPALPRISGSQTGEGAERGEKGETATDRLLYPAIPFPELIDLPGGEGRTAREKRTRREEEHRPTLFIYCLGSFRVFLDSQPISEWSSRKGLSVLKYLSLQHPEPTAKDILMDTFWQDMPPESARRNLHQAIYALRKDLNQTGSNIQHILFEEDAYLLNSEELRLWLDFMDFERHVEQGQKLHKLGHHREAIEAFGIAEGLYEGDFLQEDLYEEWTNLQRNHLKNLYLDIACQISDFFIQSGDTVAAIALCRKILTQDPICERAHLQLMWCYMKQGQRHLAIRQFQACRKMLMEELGLHPSEETLRFYKNFTENGD